ncbi:MAG: hypothetical protein DRP11_01875 [Candidatus Aenigmatarchaeota archaeon]|nr:MAG: hypothetical protein DRP11_01875 [Candidatus Aenigmarchaeota archaeon]
MALPEDHLKQSEYWLKVAEFLEKLPERDENKNTVIAALAIHSAIKSCDALSLKYIGRTPSRHDQAVELFKHMVTKGLIPPEYTGLRKKLDMMIKKKSAADYHAEFFSLNDARNFLSIARKLIELAKRLI